MEKVPLQLREFPLKKYLTENTMPLSNLLESFKVNYFWSFKNMELLHGKKGNVNIIHLNQEDIPSSN